MARTHRLVPVLAILCIVNPLIVAGFWLRAERQSERALQQRLDFEPIHQLAALEKGQALGSALRRYTFAHGETGKDIPFQPIPTAEKWEQALRPYLRADGDPFIIPTGPGRSPHRFAINTNMAGKSWGDIVDQESIVFFESVLRGPNASGDESSLPPTDGVSGVVVIYANGHAVYLSPSARRIAIAKIR